MTHFTVADIKRGRIGSKPKVPAEGTFLKSLYDAFVFERRSVHIEPKTKKLVSGSITNLIIRYGLDIRCIGNKTYVCFGTEDEDFCIENLDELKGS